ncbi:MAG TPA: LecA/PA-IL family lectin [Pyrinomonadaceae bacterium]|nr:LecA/PA-IL family lectin [Pyrinomonadaceae bacterium]
MLAAAVLVAVLSCAAFADTLRLKDGSIIKGRIVSFGGGKFTVVIGEGSRRRELTFLASEVESITFADADANVAASQPARRYEPAQPVQPQQQRQQGTPPVLKGDGRTASQKPVSQQPTTIQQPRVINTNATGAEPGRVDPPKPTPALTAGPIAWDVTVKADNTSNGWTNTGWVVKKGQRIRITGDGIVQLGKGKTSTPSGDPDIPDQQKLLKNVATGALLAVIGDDNNDFIYVGASREFTATRDGALFLGINEGYLDDNTGAYKVKVEILPDGN